MNLENELLPKLQNNTIKIEVLNSIEHYSKLIPHINYHEVDGDSIEIVSLPSYEPKDWKWGYDKENFKPEEVSKFTMTVSNENKKIFYTVYSKDIEKQALNPAILDKTLAKQADQVGYDASLFLDDELIKKYICNLDNYKDGKAKIVLKRSEINRWIEQGIYAKNMAKLIMTKARLLRKPSTDYNKKGIKCNSRDLSNLLVFTDSGLYTQLEVELTGPTTSMSLEYMEKKFRAFIEENLENNVLFAIIDRYALGVAVSLVARALVYDGYVHVYKILDHLWRQSYFADNRPALVCYVDEDVPVEISENEEEGQSSNQGGRKTTDKTQ